MFLSSWRWIPYMYSFSSKCGFLCFFSETIMFLHEIFHQGLKARLANWPTLVLGKPSCITHTSKHCVNIHPSASVTWGLPAPSLLVGLIDTHDVPLILSPSHTHRHARMFLSVSAQTYSLSWQTKTSQTRKHPTNSGSNSLFIKHCLGDEMSRKNKLGHFSALKKTWIQITYLQIISYSALCQFLCNC